MQRVSTHGLALLALAGPAVAQPAGTDAAPTAELEPVVVIGTSPLPGQGIDRDRLPYGTQVIRRERIDASKSLNLVDYLNRSVPGVQVNEITGNPYQGDLTYRGFRASPLLGAGQGLSVYLDGVRINEPFGDVVNFDLIPEFAVRSISLVPGANPAFGLNSLGGALAYTTYDGRSAPGLRGELSGGSFGRGKLSLSYGRSGENGWHQYVAATGFTEDGWRDHSDSDLGQFLGKIGRDDGTTELDAGPAARQEQAGRQRPGAGLHLRRRRRARARPVRRTAARPIYTHPDETKNRLEQLSFNLQHALDAAELDLRAGLRAPHQARHRQRRRGRRLRSATRPRSSTPPTRARPAMARA